MKKAFFFILSILLIAGCDESQHKMRSFDPQTIFRSDDARLILGYPASSLQSSAGISPEGLASFKTKYETVSPDSATGKKGTLVVAYNEFASVTAAEKEYLAIAKTDAQSPGMKMLKDVRDEAYFNSDDSTFCYLLLRKDKKTFQMSMIPVTGRVSPEQFNTIAKRVADSL